MQQRREGHPGVPHGPRRLTRPGGHRGAEARCPAEESAAPRAGVQPLPARTQSGSGHRQSTASRRSGSTPHAQSASSLQQPLACDARSCHLSVDPLRLSDFPQGTQKMGRARRLGTGWHWRPSRALLAQTPGVLAAKQLGRLFAITRAADDNDSNQALAMEEKAKQGGRWGPSYIKQTWGLPENR